MGLSDIHCHILPYVDDGARTLDEAKKMILEQIEQGVSTVYLTPHLRTDYFEKSDESIISEFNELCLAVKDYDIKLYLSREYFCDNNFLERLAKGDVLTLSEQNHILVEFSYMDTEGYILECIQNIVELGYIPILVHIERFKVFQSKKSDIISKLISQGAMIQINTESVLGKMGFKIKSLTKYWLKNDLVHFIASDCHRLDMRVPDLGKCAKYLSKKISKQQFEQIFYINPNELSKIKMEN